MRNIALELMYDGTNYFGYQRQKGFITIQESIESALSQLTKEDITIYGCGRTDTGVHALKYVCSFNTNSKMPADRLPVAMNSILNKDIVILSARDVSPKFHGRFSVKEKTYVYKILNTSFSDPFLANYVWHYKYSLDINKMKEAAEYIKGYHDFSCFMASGAQVKTTDRTVKKLEITDKNGMLEIEISADGFLYNMVRIITGTLVYVGCGKLTPADVKNIVESTDRRLAGITAPPQGLYLKDVVY